MSVDLGSAVGRLELRSDGVTRGVAAAARALRDFESQSSTAGRNLDQIGQAGQRAGAQVASGAGKASAAIRDLGKSTADVSGAFDRLGGSAGLLGGALAAGLGVAVKGASDLQTELAAISTIAPNVNIAQIGDEIQAMTSRVARSQTELASGLYNIFGSVEVSQSEALRLLEEFSQGAISARTDTEVFSKAVLGTLAAYGQGVSQAEHVSDVFFSTIAAGVVTGDQLASGLGNVANAANTAGVNIDQLGALIAGVSRTGGDASARINDLSNLLQKLTTSDVQEGLNKLGVATKNADGSFRDILAVLADLDAALGKLSQSQRAEAIQKLFPDQQARNGLTSVLSQLQFITKEAENNAKAVGVADAAYQKMGNTAAANATKLRGTITATLSELGEIALPGLVGLAERVQSFVEVIGALPPSAQEAIVVSTALSSALLLVGSMSVRAYAAIVAMAPAFQAVAAGARTAATALYSYATAATAAQAASVLGPALVAIGLAAAGTALTMDSLTRATKEAGAAISGDLGQAIAKIETSKLEALEAFFTGTNTAADDAAEATRTWARGQDLDTLLIKIKEVAAANKELIDAGRGDSPTASTQRAVVNALFEEIAARRKAIEVGAEQQRQLAALNAQYEIQSSTSFAFAPELYDEMTESVNQWVGALHTAAIESLNLKQAQDSASLGNTSPIDAVTQAYRAQHDAISRSGEAAARHRAELQALDDALARQASAIQQVQQATGPLQTALDQINAKRAAGLPLTQRETSLLAQIPGYLGEASTAYSDLALAQAQTAINAINAKGGIAAMGTEFTGTSGQASGLTGELNRLAGAIQAITAAERALSAQDAQLTSDYNLFQKRVDALEAQKKSGGLSPEEQAELERYKKLLDDIAGRLGENAAKERELAEERIRAGDAAVIAAQKLAEANRVDLAAKQDPFIFREDRRTAVGADILPPPPPVPVEIEPTVDDGDLAAVRKVLGQPVTVPVKVDLEGLGGGSTKGALGIAESMGLATTGTDISIAVSANTNAADTAIEEVRRKLTEINQAEVDAQIGATDTASGIAATVITNIGAIPAAHDTVLTATDNASGPIRELINTINSVPTTLNVTAHVDTSGALGAIAELRANMPSSPAEKGPFRTLPDWSSVFSSLAPAGDDAVLSIEQSTVRMARAIGAGIDDASAVAAKQAAELASSVAGAVSATDDALARLRRFRAPDPGQFERFRAAMEPILDAFAADGAASGERAAESAGKWAESAGKVFQAVSAGADALAKLRDYIRPADESIRAFRDASQYLTDLMIAIAADSDTELTEAGAAWAEAAGKIYGSVGAGVEALTKLRQFQRPTDRAIQDFRDVSQFLVNVLAQVAADFEARALPQASEWAETAGAIFGALGSGVDALAKLGAFDRPSDQAVRSFRDVSQFVVNLLSQVAADIEADALPPAKAWAETADAIFGALSSGVAALAALRTFERPTDRAVRDFRDVSQYVVNLLAEVAADIESQALPQARDWADTAEGIFGALSSGVDALTQLHDFQRPTDRAIEDFRDVSQHVVNLLAQVAADIEADALPPSREWAETAGAIFGALGSGVEALTQLHEFERPTDRAVESFRDVSQFVVNLFAEVAADMESRALPQAKAWAETAQAVYGAIGAGVEGLAGLDEFERPTDEALRSFRDVTALAVALIAEVAAQTDAEMTEAAATYAEGAGKVLSLIGTGVSTLGQLGDEEFRPPDRGTLDRIAQATREATLAIAEAARLIDAGAVEDAGVYADGAGKAVGLIGSGLAAFADIADFVPPSETQIRNLVNVTSETVRRIAEAASTMDQEAVAAAGEYGENGGKAIGIVGATLAAFGNLKDFVAPSKKAIDQVLAATQYATDRLAAIAATYDPDAIRRLGEFGDGVSSGLGAVRSALDLGKAFQDKARIKPADALGTALGEFRAGLPVMDQLVAVSQDYKTKGAQFGANIAEAYASIAAALPGYTPQSQAAANVTVGAQTTVRHEFAGKIDFGFLGENGQWIVRSWAADDVALIQSVELIAGKLLPVFRDAIEAV